MCLALRLVRRFESNVRAVCSRVVKHGQYEYAVLHCGYGSRRLPAEKFLRLLSVIVIERRELTSQARYQVNVLSDKTLWSNLFPVCPTQQHLCFGLRSLHLHNDVMETTLVPSSPTDATVSALREKTAITLGLNAARDSVEQ